MIGYIYRIKNKTNKKAYIGRTFNFKGRWKRHLSNMNILDYPLYRAFRKYGIDNFKFEILVTINVKNKKILSEQLNELEIKLIKKYNTYKKGYNQTTGGCGGSFISKETKMKLSIANKGKHLSEEHKRKISKANKGKHHTKETKRKMSMAGKGRVFSEEHKKKISLAHKGKQLSEETKRKLSIVNKGKQLSEETKRKISSHFKKNPMTYWKSKQFSEEHKKKISEAHKGRKNPNYSKQFSKETKRKMSIANKGKRIGKENPKARSVINIDTGKVFDTITEAAKYYNIKSRPKISEACSGKQKTVGCFHWEYYNNVAI